MAKILGIGIATLDIINEVEDYPIEDSEQRALTQHQRTGGNVTNALTVLRQFDHDSALGAVLTPDADGLQIQEKLTQRGIDLTPAQVLGFGHAPTSYITLNRRNGSRTIVHYRDLPEFDLNAFLTIDRAAYDWLHFEGRHCMDTAAMLALVAHDVAHDKGSKICSLEVEKERPHLDQLFSFPDVIFFSRAFALQRGFDDPQAFLNAAHQWAPQAVLILGWGATGAFFKEAPLTPVQAVPAQPVSNVVDSIGAGDTLIAGVIHTRLNQAQADWHAAVTAGVRLAERKIQQFGFDGLAIDPNASEQPLCHLDELGPEDALGARPINGIPSVIVVREQRAIRAYRNVCPHNGSPLSKGARGFLATKKDGAPTGFALRCTLHNAHFEPLTGACTAGPCPGTHLSPVAIRQHGALIYLDDLDEQPESINTNSPTGHAGLI